MNALLPQFHNFISVIREFAIKCRLCDVSAGLGLQVSIHLNCMNASMVFSSGFGSAESFCVFQLWVQEGTAVSALPTTHPDTVDESFLHVGVAVVRRQDTSRARVQVVWTLVGGLRVAQVLNPCHLLPSTLGVECVLQMHETSPIS